MPDSGIAQLLSELVGGLPSIVPTVALYGAGSLGTNDFQPDRSDLDLIAVLERVPSQAELGELAKLHRRLERTHPAAERLRCIYLPVDSLADRVEEWPYWADGRIRQRAFTAIARAELHDHGVVVAGPPVQQRIPYVTHEELIEDVRAELTSVWLPASARRLRWWSNAWVDIGLTVLPRAAAAVEDGTLLTKTQAIARLDGFDVPSWVRDDMLARRRGWVSDLGVRARVRRARIAREAVRRGAERLLS